MGKVTKDRKNYNRTLETLVSKFHLIFPIEKVTRVRFITREIKRTYVHIYFYKIVESSKYVIISIDSTFLLKFLKFLNSKYMYCLNFPNFPCTLDFFSQCRWHTLSPKLGLGSLSMSLLVAKVSLFLPTTTQLWTGLSGQRGG